VQMTDTIQRIVLASRPVGEPVLDNFRSEKLPIPHAGPSQMPLRTLWLSLDPYMRGRMSDAPSYAKPVGIGDLMEGGTVSEVVTSNVPQFAKGDILVGRTGWQTHALSDGSGVQKVDPTRAPIQTALGVLGMPGMPAYMGLLEIGLPLARPRWSQQLLVRSARLSARSPESRVPTPSASPEDRRNAVT
jgi:NADPH-dependent curcumin reductase